VQFEESGVIVIYLNFMSTKAYKKKYNRLMKFSMENQDGMMFLFNSDRDYVAARCCVLNGLVGSGFVLAGQAIEKSLKAFIFFESKKKLRVGHNAYELKEALKKIKDYNLDKYDNLLKKLLDHYQARYSDNIPEYGTNGACSDELAEIDELWVELKEKLPIPDEVKYRTVFFTDILKPNPHWSNEFWLKQHNPVIFTKLNKWQKEFKKIWSK